MFNENQNEKTPGNIGRSKSDMLKKYKNGNPHVRRLQAIESSIRKDLIDGNKFQLMRRD